MAYEVWDKLVLGVSLQNLFVRFSSLSVVSSYTAAVAGGPEDPDFDSLSHMTLLDLMIAVGGMTEFADGNNSVLVRLEEGGQRSYGLRLDDLVKDGDISANLNLMPGDVIIISESWF